MALITSISTLAGGLLASITSLRIQRRQTNIQNAIVLSERAEREDANRRQIRRDAYVHLLTCFDGASDALDKCWEAIPPADADGPVSEEVNATRKLLVSLDTALNTVNLEGPPTVYSAATQLSTVINNQLNKLVHLNIDNEGSKEPLFKIAGPEYKVWKPRLEAKSAFIEVAREALERTTIDIPIDP